MTHDTAAFAAASLRQWWQRLGRAAYPEATEVLLTADAGGSNGYRTQLWKRERQPRADDTGLALTGAHVPPGTSKRNKIEQRTFCHLTETWRGRPLTSLEAIVNLIANTTTSHGLTLQAAGDTNPYEKGIRVSTAEMSHVHLTPAAFHGEWNYTISPRSRSA